MPKLLVVGAPGTGKTTLVEYAKKHGRGNFFDTDMVKGLCEWRNYKTGQVVGPVEDITPEDSEDWYKTNGWYWISKRLNKLLDSCPNPVICGSADNIMDFYEKFDRLILLYKSREDIVHNLSQPGRNQPNGKDPRHHDRIIKWQEKLLESTEPYKPLIITENNTEVAFDKILALLKL